MTGKLLFAGLMLASISSAAAADEVFSDDVIVDGRLCAGSECFEGILFGNSAAKLRSNQPDIEFDDTSTGDEPANDWRIDINGTGALAPSYFSIVDSSADVAPFTLAAGAPDNAFYVDPDGKIGIGTMLPARELHLLSPGGNAHLRIENTPTFGSPTTWDLRVSAGGGLGFIDNGGGSVFLLRKDAPNSSLVVDHDGNVGLGTLGPDAPLEVSSSGTFNFFRITARGAATNESVDVVFTEGPLGTGQLRYNIVEAADSPQVPEMLLDADGNVVLTGTLTTTGPTCAGGCDRVFDADYALPSIRDHAATMYAEGHLPGVGPTLPHQPINMTEKLGQMLNALEHAHVYIAQQDELIRQLQADKRDLKQDLATLSQTSDTRFEQLTQRLSALE